MANFNDYSKRKSQKISLLIKILSVILVVLIAVFIYFAVSDNSNKKEPVDSPADDDVKTQQVSSYDIAFLEESGIITGIHDIKIKQGTDISLKDLTDFDETYIKSLTIDDSNVDYDKVGKYQATGIVIMDGEKLREFLKDENAEVAFDTSGDTVTLNVSFSVNVIDEETAREETAKGNEVITDDSKIPSKDSGSDDSDSKGSNSKDKETSGKTSGSSGSTSGSSSASGGSSGSQSNHKHVWKTRTETVQEEQKVTVTEETVTYTLYRFYWYNTNKWEESRDHDRFVEWQKSDNGQLYPLKHPFKNPEDNPLFIGYDGNGNPQYTNDHTITSNLSETVPCEPYEKTEMVNVKRTVTYCSICGATK